MDIIDPITQALRHNTRKKSLQGLQSIAVEIIEENTALGVFHLYKDKALLEKLEDLLQLIEKDYHSYVE